jgi:lipopolysaccharide transport system permease protein
VISSKASPHYRARFQQPRVQENGPGELVLECAVENAGDRAWLASAGDEEDGASRGRAAGIGPVHLSYQVFDAQTGQLLMDGARSSLEEACQPGSRASVRIPIQLPAEPGHYRIWVSPVHEPVAWFYQRGSEFLELDVTAERDRTRVRSVERRTRLGRRIERMGQLLHRSFAYPLRTFVRHSSLIFSMVRRDLQGRYRGSAAGAWWTLAQPLLLMSAYYFVFGVVLRVQAEQSSGGFVFYFLCGMVPWLAVNETLQRAPNIVLDNSNFVKRVIFPLEILPVNLTLTGLATEAFALVIFLAALALVGPGISWTALYFPVVLIPQLLLTLGLCWFLAALGVFLRDTGQIMPFLMTIWFFATPIVYSSAQLPQQWLWLFRLNPLYPIVNAYRAIFLQHTAPHASAMGLLWVVSVAVFWFGHTWFYKVKKSFADLI